ncbi:permease prefix domain 1-containing protein [Intestinimonas massiliensis (ex Afouda et al. 2020)]|uniref:permease prefix domain 1-containing protein n=1 Tax=Intestinimonas massiliensis (ex Afouda et al. 2020) TaxID=1673721 RepID=UPI0010301578|nr:permease prefix domain 1-containing protein [Intestinimonas massiliensis (ex Afouda et al. 2020)]
MEKPDTIRSYLEAVAEQIRWRRARPVVTWELERHLEDQRDAFAAEGHENAEAMAVAEMGDPVSVGAELDRMHRPRPQWGLLALAILLALAGTVLRVWLTADWDTYYMDVNPYKAALAFLLGGGALLAGYFLDYGKLGRRGGWIYLGALVVSFLLLVASPKTLNGVRYYLRYAVLLYPLAYVLWVYACRKKGWLGLLAAMAGVLPLLWFCQYAPSTLGAFLLLSTGTLVLLVAAWQDWFGLGRQKTLWVTAACTGAAGIAGVRYIFRNAYTSTRLAAFLHPEQFLDGAGYHTFQIRSAVSGARWLGQGSWNPENPYPLTVSGSDSDTFLTTLIHRLGWLPFLAVVLAFAALAVWILLRCLRQSSQLGKAVVLAALLPLCIQSLFSTAWNLGFTLLSSPFPLITGNTSTVLDLFLIGLCLSVFREERIARDSAYDYHKVRLPRYRIKIMIQKV